MIPRHMFTDGANIRPWYDPHAHPERHGLVPEPFPAALAALRREFPLAALKLSSAAYRHRAADMLPRAGERPSRAHRHRA